MMIYLGVLSLFGFAAHDESVGPFVVTGFESPRRLPPRSYWMPSAGRLPLAAAVRVVHRIHRHAAVVWHPAQPPRAPGLAQRNVLVFYVPDLSNGSHAISRTPPRLTGRQLQQCHRALARNQLRLRTRRTGHLRALAGPPLDVLNY